MINVQGFNAVSFNELTDEEKQMIFGADSKSGLVEKMYGDQMFSVVALATNLVRTVQVATSAVAQHPNQTVMLPSDFRVVGGGAQVNWTGAGNLLTASRPVFQSGLEGWFGASKDHSIASPASISVWAIGLKWT